MFSLLLTGNSAGRPRTKTAGSSQTLTDAEIPKLTLSSKSNSPSVTSIRDRSATNSSSASPRNMARSIMRRRTVSSGNLEQFSPNDELVALEHAELASTPHGTTRQRCRRRATRQRCRRCATRRRRGRWQPSLPWDRRRWRAPPARTEAPLPAPAARGQTRETVHGPTRTRPRGARARAARRAHGRTHGRSRLTPVGAAPSAPRARAAAAGAAPSKQSRRSAAASASRSVARAPVRSRRWARQAPRRLRPCRRRRARRRWARASIARCSSQAATRRRWLASLRG